MAEKEKTTIEEKEDNRFASGDDEEDSQNEDMDKDDAVGRWRLEGMPLLLL